MIRKTGIHYYCNIASPSLYDGEAIKNIDYDLDVKVAPNGKSIILDEEEYERHGREMGYSEELKEAIEKGMKRVMVDIRLRNSPFEHGEIWKLYERYLKQVGEDREKE